MTSLFFKFALAIGCGLLLASETYCQKPGSPDGEILEPVAVKKDLYPVDTDAKHEIDNALARTAIEKKRVLLIFGGNWCYDCHVLDQALHEGEAAEIANQSFVLVHVDIGEGDKNLDLAQKYKIPLEKGVPAVAILGRKGDLLYSSGDGEFESARSLMKKDLVAFLTRWKEP
jgi:thiol:disulfide interchange protein